MNIDEIYVHLQNLKLGNSIELKEDDIKLPLIRPYKTLGVKSILLTELSLIIDNNYLIETKTFRVVLCLGQTFLFNRRFTIQFYFIQEVDNVSVNIKFINPEKDSYVPLEQICKLNPTYDCSCNTVKPYDSFLLKEAMIWVAEICLFHEQEKCSICAKIYLNNCKQLASILSLNLQLNDGVPYQGSILYPYNFEQCHLAMRPIYSTFKLSAAKKISFGTLKQSLVLEEFGISFDNKLFDLYNYNNYIVNDSNPKYYTCNICVDFLVTKIENVIYYLSIPIGECQNKLFRMAYKCIICPNYLHSDVDIIIANDKMICHLLETERGGDCFNKIKRSAESAVNIVLTDEAHITEASFYLNCISSSENNFTIQSIDYVILYGNGITAKGCITKYNYKSEEWPVKIFVDGNPLVEIINIYELESESAQLAFPELQGHLSIQDKMFEIMTFHTLGEPYKETSTPLNQFGKGFSLLGSGANSIRVTDINAEGYLDTREIQVSLELDTSRVLDFDIGQMKVVVRRLGGFVNYSPHNTGLGLHGIIHFEFTKSKFDLLLSAVYDRTGDKPAVWNFEAALKSGSIQLFDIINTLTGWNLSIGGGADLEVTGLHVKYSTLQTYYILCNIDVKIPVAGAEIKVSGILSKLAPNANPSMELSGELSIQKFLFFARVIQKEDENRDYNFMLRFDELLVRATYESKHSTLKHPMLLRGDQPGGIFKIRIEKFNIGALIRAIMSVLRPNVNFKLPSPWDLLNRIQFPTVIITFDTETEDISVKLSLDVDLIIIQIKEVGFTYKKATEKEKEKFMVNVDYVTLLSQENEALQLENYTWDAYNEPAPGLISEVERKKFTLHYFGLGRHVDLGIQDVKNQPLINIISECQKHLKQVKEAPFQTFNERYEWFIGAHFTISESIEVALLFYDPLIYGLQAKVKNDNLVPLKGLDLTIYYRKITEDIGLFYLFAVLPERVKHMKLGSVSIDLPNIELWIYTNGNFKVNFGFPKNGDFSLCFGLTFNQYYGKGGFYFGLLSGATSSAVPKTTKGYFDTVIELGLGLLLGIGKGYRSSIVTLEAHLEVSGIFEGVFAQFISKDNSGKTLYYRCVGVVCISGEINGSVDFKIIKAGFHCYVRASIMIAIEAGRKAIGKFSAAIGVSAYVRIFIIKFSFSYHFTFEYDFEMGSDSPMPWLDTVPLLAGQVYEYDWKPVRVLDSVSLQLFVTPYFSKEYRKVSWSGNAGELQVECMGQPEEHKIAFVMGFLKEDFPSMIELMAVWTIGAQHRGTQNKIGIIDLKALLDELRNEDCPGFQLDRLNELLSLNVKLCKENTVFSILHQDYERMMAADQHEEQVPVPFPPFLKLLWNTLQEDGEYEVKEYNLLEVEDAKTLFAEYFRLLAKVSLQKALEYMESNNRQEMTVNDVSAYIKKEAKGDVSGIVSRMLFSGGRKNNMAIFESAAQQFIGLAPGCREKTSVVHKLEFQMADPNVTWLELSEEPVTIAEGDLKYPQGALQVKFLSQPKILPFQKKERDVIALYNRQPVFLNDAPQFYLWNVPGDLSGLGLSLQIEVWERERLNYGEDLNGAAYEKNRGVLLTLELERQENEQTVYSIVNAVESTRRQLREMTQSKVEIQDVYLLFQKKIRKAEEKKPASAYFYEEGRNDNTCLIRRNLSEITTAPRMDGVTMESDIYSVSLQQRADFFALLYRILEIGGEGHYLNIGGKALGSDFIEDNGHTQLHLYVRTDRWERANIIQLSDIADGSSKIPVIVNPEIPQKVVQSMKIGMAGFDFKVKGEGEAYSLLYYNLQGRWSSPISMHNEGDDQCLAAEGGSYYSHIFELPQYDSKTPLLDKLKNPYAGILPDDYKRGASPQYRAIDLGFSFADVVGNITDESNQYKPVEPLILLYEDSLKTLREIPCTKISYCMEPDQDAKMFDVVWQLKYNEQPDDCESIQLRQIADLYYQFACHDVQFDLEVAFGTYKTGRQTAQEDQKQDIIRYLRELYQYLKSVREGGTAGLPGDVKITLKFLKIIEEPVYRLTVGKIAVTATIARDPKYVDSKALSREVFEISNEILPSENLDDFNLKFEACFKNAKLLTEEGLFAAFFPEQTLKVTAPEVRKLFYGLKPISTKLISRTGIKLSTVKNRLDNREIYTKMAYYVVDIDQWALSFLHFYEELLTSAQLNSLVKNEVSPKAINSLLLLKKELAGEIVQRVESLFLDGQGGREDNEAARSAIRDYLLKNLEKGYQAAGAVIYDTPGCLEDQYALEGALSNIPGVLNSKFAGESQTAFVVAPKVVGAASSISMEGCKYTFAHMENKRNGRWLRFLKPFSQFGNFVTVEMDHYPSASGSRQIPVILPVPLKGYPTAPKLKGQKAQANKPNWNSYLWKYSTKVDCALAAQDTLHTVLYYDREAPRAVLAERDLFDYLAQFIFNREEYEKILLKGDNQTGHTMTEVLENFCQLATAIIGVWNSAPTRRLDTTYGYAMRPIYTNNRLSKLVVFGDHFPEGLTHPQLTVSDEDGNTQLCSYNAAEHCYKIDCDKIKIEVGASFTADALFDGLQRSMYFGFDSAVYLTRNANYQVLPGDQPDLRVNPDFIYETSLTGYQSMVSPVFLITEAHNGGVWSPELAAEFLSSTVRFCEKYETELYVDLGQRMEGRQIAFRPIKRHVQHSMTAQSAAAFFREAEAVWKGRGLEGKESYFVRITVKQFYDQAGEKSILALAGYNLIFNL